MTTYTKFSLVAKIRLHEKFTSEIFFRRKYPDLRYVNSFNNINNNGGGGEFKNTCRQVIKNLIGVTLQFVWAFNEREKGAGVHSFPVLVKVGRAIVWEYTLSCQLVYWERRV